MTCDYKKGFADQTKEITVSSLEVEGVIPDWLSGTLVRNGPARFRLEGKTLNHWFDGLAMLHKFDIANGHVSYANRFLDTPALRAAKDGKMKYGEFATDPCRSLFKRITQVFTGSTSGANANVSIGKIAKEFVAQTETPLPVAFEVDTLKTMGIVSYSDGLKGNLTTAHPHQDQGDQFNYLLSFGRKSTYNVYRLSDGSKKRQLIGSYSTDRPSYMHSFGLSQQYLILMEFPLVVNPISMLVRGKPFIANYTWKPERGTRFSLVDRQTGEGRYAHTDEAWFGFHHVNAFDNNDHSKIDLDIIVYPDADVVEYFYLNSLLNKRNQEAYPKNELRRFTINVSAGTVVPEGWLTIQPNCRA